MNGTLVSLITGVVLLIGVGGATVVSAQSQSDRDTTRQVELPNGEGSIEVTTPELTPETEARWWQQTRQEFVDAGITLNVDQEARLRQANRQLTLGLQQAGMSNPFEFLAYLVLPQDSDQADQMLRSTVSGRAFQAYSEVLENTLTPNQLQRWESYLDRQQTAQATESQLNFSFEPTEADRAADAQFLEELKQEFQDAGVPLTSDQETQLLQANKQLITSLQQMFQEDPNRSILQVLSLAVLPQPAAEASFDSSLLINPLTDHVQAVSRILTPEQYRIWEQGFGSQQEQGQ